MVNFSKTHLSTSTLTTYTHSHSPRCTVLLKWSSFVQEYNNVWCSWYYNVLTILFALLTGQWPKLIQFGLPGELTLSHAFCLYALATVLIFICSFLVVFTGLVALLTVFTTILTVFPPYFLAKNFELMEWNSEQAWFRIYLMILPVTHCIVACLIEVSMNCL